MIMFLEIIVSSAIQFQVAAFFSPILLRADVKNIKAFVFWFILYCVIAITVYISTINYVRHLHHNFGHGYNVAIAGMILGGYSAIAASGYWYLKKKK